MAKTPRTRLLRRSRNQLRKVTRTERLDHPELFSPKGDYLVSKSVKRIDPNTVFITRSSWQDARLGVLHGKAAKLRAEGRLGYGPKGEERAVPKSVQTFRLKRAIARLEYAEKRATPHALKKRHRASKSYQVTPHMRASFWEWRARKVNGEFLDDGDWHEMADMANAVNDPMLSILLRSP